MDNYPYITILTPTYNRAKKLPRLFLSLQQQHYSNFEWLIVNDGSTDNTLEIIASFIKQSNFLVRFINKKNEGKHSALNIGFEAAAGSWIFIVDSDDWLPDLTLQKIENELIKIEKIKNVASFCALRVDENGNIIGDRFSEHKMPETYIECHRMNILGDKADIVKKSVLSHFKFPVFLGENFMAESPLWLFIGSNYLTKFSNTEIYYCQYLTNGLSASSLKNRIRCTNSTLYVYEDQFHRLSSTLLLKAKAAINWWRFYYHGKKNYQGNWYAPYSYAPIGLLAHALDKWKLAND